MQHNRSLAPVHLLSRDIADQGAWVGMPRARLEYWAHALGELEEAQKRILAAQLVVLARGLRQALRERGGMAVLQLVTLVRHMLGEHVDVSSMFETIDRKQLVTRTLGVVHGRPKQQVDEAQRLFEVMTR